MQRRLFAPCVTVTATSEISRHLSNCFCTFHGERDAKSSNLAHISGPIDASDQPMDRHGSINRSSVQDAYEGWSLDKLTAVSRASVLIWLAQLDLIQSRPFHP